MKKGISQMGPVAAILYQSISIHLLYTLKYMFNKVWMRDMHLPIPYS